MTGGDVVAMIINWKEIHVRDYEFSLEEIGIVPTQGQTVEVFDLWTHESVGIFDSTQAAKFAVKDIPGHGNFTFRFHISGANT